MICPKLYEYYGFPQSFHTMKLGETTVFFAVGTKEFIPRISEAHAVFDCNTVAPYHGAAKDDIAKKT